MPPRWPRKPDRRDPAFRRLEDRINFAVHVALFAAANSGSWFFRVLQDATWPWTIWMTGIWGGVLLLHGLYIFGLADYSGADAVPDPASKDSKPEQI
jgi:integral membrane sensor domain MASE1